MVSKMKKWFRTTSSTRQGTTILGVCAAAVVLIAFLLIRMILKPGESADGARKFVDLGLWSVPLAVIAATPTVPPVLETLTAPPLRPTPVVAPPMAAIAPSRLTLPAAETLTLPAFAFAAPVLVRIPAAVLEMVPLAELSVMPPLAVRAALILMLLLASKRTELPAFITNAVFNEILLLACSHNSL